jgi:hypothetical protein
VLEFSNNPWGLGTEIGLLYRPTRLYRLAELITWNRYQDSLSLTRRNGQGGGDEKANKGRLSVTDEQRTEDNSKSVENG